MSPETSGVEGEPVIRDPNDGDRTIHIEETLFKVWRISVFVLCNTDLTWILQVHKAGDSPVLGGMFSFSRIRISAPMLKALGISDLPHFLATKQSSFGLSYGFYNMQCYRVRNRNVIYQQKPRHYETSLCEHHCRARQKVEWLQGPRS